MKGTRTGRTVSHLRDQKGYQDGLTSRRQSYKPFRRFAWLRIQLDFIKFLEASLVLGMSVSVDYNIFAWCCGISIYKNWKKICTDVNTGIFPIPIAYWSGFEISKQNRGNPGEIGMVEQSDCPWFVVRKCITLQAPRSLARRRWQLPNTQIHNNFLLWKFLEIAAMM